MQIFRRIPRGGNQHIRLRVSLLGLETRHHLTSGGLENIYLNAGFLLIAAGKAFRQRARPGGVDGERLGAGDRGGGQHHRERGSFGNGDNGFHTDSPEVEVTARTAAMQPADK